MQQSNIDDNIIDNIDDNNTLSGERYECAPSGRHNPLSPEHENGNDTRRHSFNNDYWHGLLKQGLHTHTKTIFLTKM